MIRIVCAGVSVDELRRLDVASIAVVPVFGSRRRDVVGATLRWLRWELGWLAALRVIEQAERVVLVRPPRWAKWLIAQRLEGRPAKPRTWVEWQEQWEGLGKRLLETMALSCTVKPDSPAAGGTWPATARLVILT